MSHSFAVCPAGTVGGIIPSCFRLGYSWLCHLETSACALIPLKFVTIIEGNHSCHFCLILSVLCDFTTGNAMEIYVIAKYVELTVVNIAWKRL